MTRICISSGKTGRHYDRDTVQVIEKIDGTEVVVRILKVYYNYIQVRGMRNCDATPEVDAFMGRWVRQVLRNLDAAA